MTPPGRHKHRREPTAHADELIPARLPVLRHLINAWRKLRRWLSRREWTVKLLGLPVSRGMGDEPGLVLIQIDGLSRRELDRALEQNRLPFVRRLLRRESYRIETMYSGQPATTPAVLAELFYGRAQAVPAFGFRDHRSGEVVQMFQPGIAHTIQQELERDGEPLLKGGAVYCDIYSGGAAESSFCPATTGWRNLEDVRLWRQFAIVLMNLMSLVRMAGFIAVELIVAVVEFIRGVTKGREFWHELLYIPRRLVINIVLREILGVSVEVDVTRGVPVIHANLLGYDENAHRRGPDSRFAHFALSGIDRTIRRIWNAAHASHRRNYHVWLMSDHGQERTTPYAPEHGRTVAEAVAEVYRDVAQNDVSPKSSADPRKELPTAQLSRARWFLRHPVQAVAEAAGIDSSPADDEPVTVTIGPLGFVYWPGSLAPAALDETARKLVSQAGIPLVIASVEESTWAWNAEGKFRLPEQAEQILAAGHPFLPEVAEDLSSLCRHPDAGTFLISGWRNDQRPVSFVPENGAHGGPGPNETSGFVLVPPDAPRQQPVRGNLRPTHLRKMVQQVLGRQRSESASRPSPHTRTTIRVVTYNVHSCIGLDGRLSPARIARVLALLAPDVIALQELDVKRMRSRHVDQAEQIARALEMQFHFHPSFEIEKEQYGNAFLSRLPMRLIRAGELPGGPRCREPRGAVWIELDVAGTPVQLLTTHLGLRPGERREQVDELLGPQWLGHPDCRQPVVLLGDFNARPGSKVYNRLCGPFTDAQLAVANHVPRPTWFSPYPLSRLDHVFVSSDVRVEQVAVPDSQLVRVASDHLPLFVDLAVPEVARRSQADRERGADVAVDVT